MGQVGQKQEEQEEVLEEEQQEDGNQMGFPAQGMSKELFAGHAMWNESNATMGVTLRGEGGGAAEEEEFIGVLAGCSDRRGGVCFRKCLDLAATEDVKSCDSEPCFKSEETFSIQVHDLQFTPSSCPAQVSCSNWLPCVRCSEFVLPLTLLFLPTFTIQSVLLVVIPPPSLLPL